MVLDDILYLAIDKCIKRKTAKILEEDDNNIVILVGDILMIATNDFTKAKELLEKYNSNKNEFVSICGDESIALYAKERFNYSVFKKCYQVAYLKNEPPKRKTDLLIRPATENDYPVVKDNYGMEYEEFLEHAQNDALFIGENKDGIVGFIGEHTEGSIGMLFIKEEYRKHGYAYDLEAFMIDKQMKKGFIPYGNVVEGNEKSLNLQKKMGMEIADGFVYWLF